MLKKVGRFVKDHPVIASVVTAAALGAGAYFGVPAPAVKVGLDMLGAVVGY